MNIFRRILGANFGRDIVSAFRIHPLSATISLFATALIIADIMQLAGISITLQYFALIAFCLALGVESVVSSLLQQLKQNKCASAHQISPDSWCKKSESKGAVVPPADFLLESDKRGSPPKSEKAAAFWRVGGAGRGVQPFLRKEKGESKSRKIANDSQIAKMDSSLTAFAQNDESLNCFGNSSESPHNDGVWQIAKFATFALIATAMYFYIAQSVENIASPTHIASPTFYLHYYALCVIFMLVFVALHLGQSFRSLYNATIRVIFLCAVCGLFGVLLLIFALLCDTLFGVSIYRFALSVEICALEAIFLLFLATFRCDIEANFGIILRILNVFAVLYLAVFLLYFIGVFALGAGLRVSIVHLVLWYSFFALFLWWLNMAKMGESLGESHESIESAHESNRILSESRESNRESVPKITSILTRFAPLGALFVLNIIAFYAIILRIAQYGVTPERYFVIIGCIALLVNLGFSAFCKKPIAKGIVAIIALVAFSAFGWKFNAIDLSLNSQYKELEKAQNSGDEVRIANIKRFIAYYEGKGESTPNEAHSEEAKFFTFDDFSAILDSKAILRIKHSSSDMLSQTSGNYRYEISDDKFVRVYQIAPKSPVACEFDLKAIARNLDKNIIKISGATIIIQSLSANFRYDSHQKPIGVDIWDFDIIILLQ